MPGTAGDRRPGAALFDIVKIVPPRAHPRADRRPLIAARAGSSDDTR
jgi:hypothetical protein